MILIGLGSNIGDREGHIVAAVRMLHRHPLIRVVKVSSLYETAPVGYTDQADFLNAVIRIESSIPPQELLDVCRGIEAGLGRVREARWGPRTIDIDILLYDDIVIQADLLTLPHPRLQDRRFVLVPIDEIAPELPVYEGLTASKLLASCPSDDVRRYGDLCWEEV